MSDETGRRIIIIGGGASAAVLASHLLREPDSDVRVTIIEKDSAVGLGLAYGRAERCHLLNVRASNMSAFPDIPDHFLQWLRATRLLDERNSGSFFFAPRPVYGRYLQSLLDPSDTRLHIVQGECRSVRPLRSGVEVTLAGGASHFSHIAVLATGNEPSVLPSGDCWTGPWADPAESGIAWDDSVAILGTGLTMVDTVLSLLERGHRGPILAISRHGLMPRVHRHVEPLCIDAAEMPFGKELSYFLRWVRGLARERGGGWRCVVDGLRPFAHQIWQSWPAPVKRRFLRHARTWWDVHRHRMAPEIEQRISDLIASGQLQVIAGKVTAVHATASGVSVAYRPRGASTTETANVKRILSCIGVGVDPADSRNPVVRNLIAEGFARQDELKLGIDVATDCAVIDRNGEASARLFAIGPITRSRFWEIVAIPDIRIQCSQLAELIGGTCAVSEAKQTA
jgi:uncharacterized NAD(P)/FAD-binding protein YdhS